MDITSLPKVHYSKNKIENKKCKFKFVDATFFPPQHTNLGQKMLKVNNNFTKILSSNIFALDLEETPSTNN